MTICTCGEGRQVRRLGMFLFALTLSLGAAQSASVDGFDYPFGPPDGTPRCPGTAQCANAWQNVQDFRENNHLGEDWNFGFAEDDLGKPVYAVANGVVVYAQDVGGDGSWKGVIIIRHTGTNLKVPGGGTVSEVTSLYGHLDVSKITTWVSVGSAVSRGQQIGVIGSTPVASTGPHLHFEIRTDLQIGVGPGYSANATGWIDPSGFIEANRTVTPIDGPLSGAFAFSTLTGLPRGSADGTGVGARFSGPNSVAVDSAGNVYVADWGNDTIRKITPAGVVSTLAGSAGNPGSADGPGASAQFLGPSGVAVDNGGNVYVADTSNHTIRKITPSGVVSTLAGSAGESGIANGTGNAARFNYPLGVAVDNSGNVYVADTDNHTIRKITPAGVVSTFAGLAEKSGSANGTGSAARFYSPSGVAVDSARNVYVADQWNSIIRKITSSRTVSTLAGSADEAGSEDGTGSAARFNWPTGVAVDRAGNIYVADYGNTVRKITPSRVVSTLAGSATDDSGSTDGIGNAARFRSPFGVAVDSAGNVYVADTLNDTIRKITAGGAVRACQ